MTKPCPQCGFQADKTQRSGNQNRYYWGIVLKILQEHTGHKTDELHEILKSKFLKSFKTIDSKKGYVELEYVRSTADLNTKEFEDYMTEIRQWASIELGCWVPEPNEQLIE